MAEVNIIERPVKLEDNKDCNPVFAPIATARTPGIIKLSKEFGTDSDGKLKPFKEV
jgi:hypothetical protein